MSTFGSINEILDFAINEEEKAWQFYNEWGQKLKNKQMQSAFADFAREELNHKAKLETVKQNPRLLPSADKTTDLKIARYIVDEANIQTAVDSREPDVQNAYLLAISKEKAAFRLYQDLARTVESEEFKNVFHMLAQEEAMHKLKLEIEYEDHFLQEN
ncbi:MAG: ferritin family protein [Sedimentisphaerales bacterium]|nr:ferritin family protein [Sedimentisphaerales bacterium]